jgi:hypothetical protein
MEPHPHSHIHHEKKWKEYFLEFVMIFPAVALGFKTLVEINTDCKQNLITLLNK